MSAAGYLFGPFRVELPARRLLRDDVVLPVSPRHVDVLAALLARPGTTLSKDDLVTAGWGDVAVGDNSLEQAISALRAALGPAPDGASPIQTVRLRGYRFVGDVSPLRVSDDDLETVLAPHRAFLEGRAALETLTRDDSLRAVAAFEQILAITPHDVSAHIGLANACAWQFEATRTDEQPAIDRLGPARTHAREACRLDPASAEAWATLGFVLDRCGERGDAVVAARRAVTLEPSSWRHFVRLAFVSWGEERLRAASRAGQLLPDLGLARWLAATVHIARQAFDAALLELEAGAAAQDAQGTAARFGAVGLHWLLGLVRFARGDVDAALASLHRELAFETSGHLYARECCANASYAIGAIHLQTGDREAAVAAWRDACARVPSHGPARVALASLGAGSGSGRPAPALDPVAEAVARAVHLTGIGDVAGAARGVEQALSAAPPGPAAWIVPVEPLLRVTAHPDAWARALARLRARAA